MCVGFVPHDLSHLITVADAAQRQLGLEPTFLTVAPSEMGEAARTYVSSRGYMTSAAPLLANDGEYLRNPFQRYQTLRNANMRVAHEVLAEIRPTIILATVNAAHNLLLAEATRAGIPTVLLQLFWWGDRKFYRAWRQDDMQQMEAGLTPVQRLRRKVSRGVADVFGMGYRIAWDQEVSRVAVQGPAVRRLLIRQGMPASRVVATGHPACDELYRLRFSPNGTAAEVYRQLQLPAGSRYFVNLRAHEGRLYGISQAEKDAAQVTLIRALQAADPEARVVVKLHPREGNSEEQFVRSVDPTVIVAKGEVSTNALMASSQANVAIGSTALVWSTALDRPSISAFLWPRVEYWRRAQTWSGVERVYSGPELTQAVQGYLHNREHAETWRQRRAAFVQDELIIDGTSTQRLVQLLGELCSQHRTVSLSD